MKVTKNNALAWKFTRLASRAAYLCIPSVQGLDKSP